MDDGRAVDNFMNGMEIVGSYRIVFRRGQQFGLGLDTAIIVAMDSILLLFRIHQRSTHVFQLRG